MNAKMNAKNPIEPMPLSGWIGGLDFGVGDHGAVEVVVDQPFRSAGGKNARVMLVSEDRVHTVASELADVLEVYLDGLGGGFLLDADKAKLLKRIEALHQNARIVLRKAGRIL